MGGIPNTITNTHFTGYLNPGLCQERGESRNTANGAPAARTQLQISKPQPQSRGQRAQVRLSSPPTSEQPAPLPLGRTQAADTRWVGPRKGANQAWGPDPLPGAGGKAGRDPSSSPPPHPALRQLWASPCKAAGWPPGGAGALPAGDCMRTCLPHPARLCSLLTTPAGSPPFPQRGAPPLGSAQEASASPPRVAPGPRSRGAASRADSSLGPLGGRAGGWALAPGCLPPAGSAPSPAAAQPRLSALCGAVPTAGACAPGEEGSDFRARESEVSLPLLRSG